MVEQPEDTQQLSFMFSMLHGCNSWCPKASLIVMLWATVKRFEILLELPECYTES